MLKDAPHRSSAAFSVITMGQMVRHTGLSPKKIIFLRVDYLEKCQCAHFCCQYGLLGAYQAASACLSQDLHCSLSLRYDPDCCTDGGKPSKNFFSELINFKNANLHIFGHHCFCQLWVLGEAYRSPSWDIHNFLSLLYDLNCWIIGNKPPKEVFFSELTTFKNANFVQFWSQYQSFGLLLSLSGSKYMSLTGPPLLSQSSLWPWLLDRWGQAPQRFCFHSWLSLMRICAYLTLPSLFLPNLRPWGSL